MFGLGPVYQLLVGDSSGASSSLPLLLTHLDERKLTRAFARPAATQMVAMNPMMGMAGGSGGAAPVMPGAPGQDFVKLFRGERENLDIVEYAWASDGVEERLLSMFAT